MARSHQHHHFMTGAVLGGALGAMTALLFSSDKGKKFQKEIAHKYHALSGKMGHFMGKIPLMKKKKARKSTKRRKSR